MLRITKPFEFTGFKSFSSKYNMKILIFWSFILSYNKSSFKYTKLFYCFGRSTEKYSADDNFYLSCSLQTFEMHYKFFFFQKFNLTLLKWIKYFQIFQLFSYIVLDVLNGAPVIFFKKLFLQFSYPFTVDSELPLFFSYLVRVYEFYRIQTINKTTFLVSSNVSADI